MTNTRIITLVPVLCLVLLVSQLFKPLVAIDGLEHHQIDFLNFNMDAITLFTQIPEVISPVPSADVKLVDLVETTPPEEEAAVQEEVMPAVIDPSRPMVAITFDDGPSVKTTRILELFHTYNSHATFFVVGKRVKPFATVAKSIVDQGSEVMGHSWKHSKLSKLSTESISKELTKTSKTIASVTGIAPKGYRPPYGAYSKTIKSISKELDQSIVTWSLDSLDWKTRDAEKIRVQILTQVKDGDIILCHDLYDTTYDAMTMVIPQLIEQGYQLVTVSELMEAKGLTIKPGKVYRHG